MFNFIVLRVLVFLCMSVVDLTGLKFEENVGKDEDISFATTKISMASDKYHLLA